MVILGVGQNKAMERKKCRCCLKRLGLKNFSKNKALDDGLSIYCRKCKGQKQKKYRDEQIEYYTLKEREYRIKNIDRTSAYQEVYYNRPEIIEKTKKYHKEYAKKNKEKLRLYYKEYAKKNRERLSKLALKAYYKNKEEILANRKEKYVPKPRAKKNNKKK
jgi:hypothetical protein